MINLSGFSDDGVSSYDGADGSKSKYSELLRRKNMRNQALVENQQRQILAQQHEIMQMRQQRERENKNSLYQERLEGHLRARQKPGINPNNREKLLGRNKSTRIFENDRKPLVLASNEYSRYETIEDQDKPTVHMPRYRQYDSNMSRNQMSRAGPTAQVNPKKLLYNNQSIGGTPERSRRLAVPSSISSKRQINKGKKGKKNSVH